MAYASKQSSAYKLKQPQQQHQGKDQGNRFFHFWGSSFDLFIGSLLEAAHV